MREILAFKLKQVLEEKQRLAKEEEEKAALQAEQSKELAERIGTPSHKSEKESKVIEQRSPKASTKDRESMLGDMHSTLGNLPIPERDNIDNDFKPVILSLWQELSLNYKTQMKKIFKSFRLHREHVISKRSIVQKDFLEYLHNADGKQAILNEFNMHFNLFSNEYPDLREDDQTKEELH